MFLTADEFRALEVTTSATEITAAQVDDFLQTAQDTIESLCGSELITAVAAASNNDELKTRQVRKAQQKLAAREMMLFIASRYRSGGVQVSEKDLNDSAVNSYEKFTETEARRKVLWTEAMELLTPYFTAEETTETLDKNTGSLNIPVEYVW